MALDTLIHDTACPVGRLFESLVFEDSKRTHDSSHLRIFPAAKLFGASKPMKYRLPVTALSLLPGKTE
jgi:hypothetical protein